MGFVNESQAIKETANLLIRSHLQWSGSLEGSPSKDRDNIKGQLYDACMDAMYDSYIQYAKASDVEKEINDNKVSAMFREACQIADKKWEAIRTMLDIEG